jgi:hypothetical protein
MEEYGDSQQSTAVLNSELASTTDAGEELDPDTVFNILKNRRRRYVVRYLRQHDGAAEIGDLAEHMAASEEETTVEALTSSQRKRVYVSLYQGHLPTMDDAGIIEYDKNRGTIEEGPNIGALKPYLAMCDSESQKGYHYVVVGFGLGWLLFLTSHLAPVRAFGLSPSLVLLVVFLGLTLLVVEREWLRLDELDTTMTDESGITRGRRS